MKTNHWYTFQVTIFDNPEGFDFMFTSYIQGGWFYGIDWWVYFGSLRIGWDDLNGLNITWNPS